jgi:hypothetical protein
VRRITVFVLEAMVSFYDASRGVWEIFLDGFLGVIGATPDPFVVTALDGQTLGRMSEIIV